MNLLDTVMRAGQPIEYMAPGTDIVVPIADFDGNEYDDLVDKIVKNAERSVSITSFMAFDLQKLTRFITHGKLGVKCYEGVAVDLKGRTWFFKIIDEYRAYDVGWESEEYLKEFMDRYVNKHELEEQ